jgi:electron transfer flavoprotein beta subunit
MNIIVCIKQVPDAKDVKLDPKTNTMAREGVASIMNPFDRHALEAAVQLKGSGGGTVTAVSMGPPQAEEVLREAVSCGADTGILVSDRAFAGADTWATSYTLGLTVRKVGEFDLIICGKQAIDGDTAQVGPGLAQQLGIPYVTCVRRIISCEKGVLRLERMMDDGYDEIEVDLPALITVVKEINDPRVPSLKGKMKAKKIELPVFTAADIGASADCIGLPGSPTQVLRVFPPPARGQRCILTGSLDEQLDKLVAVLKKMT